MISIYRRRLRMGLVQILICFASQNSTNDASTHRNTFNEQTRLNALHPRRAKNHSCSTKRDDHWSTDEKIPPQSFHHPAGRSVIDGPKCSHRPKLVERSYPDGCCSTATTPHNHNQRTRCAFDTHRRVPDPCTNACGHSKWNS